MKKGLIARNPHTEKLAKPHPEITALRFDNERSCLEDLPMHVRKPVFDILKQHADGAVKRAGQRWEAITVDEAFLTSVNYKLEIS